MTLIAILRLRQPDLCKARGTRRRLVTLRAQVVRRAWKPNLGLDDRTGIIDMVRMLEFLNGSIVVRVARTTQLMARTAFRQGRSGERLITVTYKTRRVPGRRIHFRDVLRPQVWPACVI